MEEIFQFRSNIRKLRMHLVFCGVFLLLPLIPVIISGDRNVYEYIRYFSENHAWIYSAGKFFSDYGNYPFYAFYLFLGIYGAVTKKKQFLLFALLWLSVQLISSVLLVRILKVAIGRPRPSVMDDIESLSDPARHSFPSGHTTDMAVSSSVFGYFTVSAILKVLVYLMILFMGVSRILAGSHYPLDVIAGAALGVFSGYIACHLSVKCFSLDRKEISR